VPTEKTFNIEDCEALVKRLRNQNADQRSGGDIGDKAQQMKTRIVDDSEEWTRVIALDDSTEVVLELSDDWEEITAKLKDDRVIGKFEFQQIDALDGHSEPYYKLISCSLDQIEGFLGRGIGEAILRMWNERTGEILVVERAQGTHATQVSNPIGAGVGFGIRMVEKKLVVWDS
jgi:hypothetical protein